MEIIVVATFNEVQAKYSVQYYINNQVTTPVYLTYSEIKNLIKDLQKRYFPATVSLDIY